MHTQAGRWWLAVRGRVRQAAWATEADRQRAALLAAVSHDLRTPLAAAKAAVSGLRQRDARLTADDREELLTCAEESLDLIGHLTASLLRGLAEAMGGTVEPEETLGGGLTMVVSLPAAPDGPTARPGTRS